jgi:hypothetical protein
MIKWIFRILLITWVATYFLTDRLPSAEEISPELYSEPVQQAIDPQQFNIVYKDQVTSVTAVADYEIRGLIVSHNDPDVWYRFDLSHDEKSIDTRDLCIIWGDNLKTHKFAKVSYKNNDYSCSYRYKYNDTGFNDAQLSNNHLITDNPAVRDTISSLNVGDQVYIKGKLVNYSEGRWSNFVRKSSLTRSDKGMGACEVIFVEEIKVIPASNHIFVLIHKLSFIALLVIIAFRVALFFKR